MPTHIEITDRTNGENDQTNVAKYQNSYRLRSCNPFKLEPVEKLVAKVMNENLENFCYDSKESVSLSSLIAAEIRGKIRALRFDRYKIIVTVTILEKASQSMEAAMGFLWDSQRDTYATYTFEGPTFFSFCCILALYYE